MSIIPGVPEPTFDELQARLVPLWKSIERLNQDEQTIVVVPALTVDAGDLKGAKLQAYEERFLFLLLLLRQPRARLVYVTSNPILPSVVDYYLDLLPGVIASQARKRLFLVAPLDGSARPLSQKIIERPRLIRQLRKLILDPERAHLVPYNTTELERDLAVALGIPMYGADPKHFHFGTKSGCRQLFQEEGVPHPAGREGLMSLTDAVDAIAAMRSERPGLEQVIMKLNEGVSGEGNARVDLRGAADGRDAIEERLRGMSFETKTTFDRYIEKLGERGGGGRGAASRRAKRAAEGPQVRAADRCRRPGRSDDMPKSSRVSGSAATTAASRSCSPADHVAQLGVELRRRVGPDPGAMMLSPALPAMSAMALASRTAVGFTK